MKIYTRSTYIVIRLKLLLLSYRTCDLFLNTLTRIEDFGILKLICFIKGSWNIIRLLVRVQISPLLGVTLFLEHVSSVTEVLNILYSIEVFLYYLLNK